jgi:2-dehydropantoate 2-reductase
MRIAVYGTGGVGGYFGGRLAEAGEDIIFIARGQHLAAMQANGLKVSSVNGDFVINPVQATDNPAEVGPVDVILVAVKSWQVPEVAEQMTPMVGPNTFIVPLENGVEAPDHLIKVHGEGPVLGGLCRIFSYIEEPGHISHVGAEPTIITGELDHQVTDRLQQLEAAYKRAKGVTFNVSDNIQGEMWSKFMFICAMSGIGAITRAPIGIQREMPEIRNMYLEMMREIRTVAEARDVFIADDAVENIMTFVDSLPPHATASMQRDIMEGRPSELDGQNGAVVRLGRAENVPTPINHLIYYSLLSMEKRARGELEFPTG